MVAVTCNSSNLGGRDEEDCISTPGKQFLRLYLKKKKKPFTKKGWWMAQGVGPEFKHQYSKKKNNNNNRCSIAHHIQG
jgi:hypothetical protein